MNEALLSYLRSNRNVSKVAGVVTGIRSTDVELGAFVRHVEAEDLLVDLTLGNERLEEWRCIVSGNRLEAHSE